MSQIKLELPLEWLDEDGEKLFPIAALVILKGLNSDGYVIHSVLPTTGMTSVDALGLAKYATLYVEDLVRRDLADTEE